MSASDRPEPGSPADWLRYAHSDLVLAETPPPTGVLLELLCYHAQQAAEKALKAALLHLTHAQLAPPPAAPRTGVRFTPATAQYRSGSAADHLCHPFALPG